MILFVTPSERAAEGAEALHQATGEKVTVAENLGQAMALLRAESYLAVVLDQYLLEAEPDEAAAAVEHMGTAVAVPVNLAISGMERFVREVRASLKRREREEAAARTAVMIEIRSELNGTVTALLLSSELALETAGLPVATRERLESVRDLVRKVCQQLEITVSTVELESQ